MRDFLLLFAIIFSLTHSAPFSAADLLDTRRQDDAIYMLFDGDDQPRIEVFDLEQRDWQDTMELSDTPTAFHIDADYIYIAFGQALYRLDHSGGSRVHLGNFEYDIKHLLSDGSLLFVEASRPGRMNLFFVDRVSGQQIDTLDSDIHHYAGFSLSLELNLIVGVDSPGQDYLHYFTYNDQGEFLVDDYLESRGTYPVGAQTFLWPDDSRFMDTSGNVYGSQSLEWENAFGFFLDFIDVMEDGSPVVVKDREIYLYDPKFLEVGGKEMESPPVAIATIADDIVYFVGDVNEPQGISVEWLSVNDFVAPEPVAPIDPAGLYFMPNDIFLGEQGIIYLFSSEYSNIFRWNLETNEWEDSISLFEGAMYVEYAPELSRIYTVNQNRKVYKIELQDMAPRERHFTTLSLDSLGLVACEEFLIVASRPGSAGSRYSYSADGELLDERQDSYPLIDSVWSQVNRRIYYFKDQGNRNNLFWEEIDESGKFAERNTPLLGGDDKAKRPVRVSPNATQVLLGSGQFFDPYTLERKETLPEPIIDAAWVQGRLFTLSETELKTWELPTYDEGAVLELAGRPLRLIADGEGNMVLIQMGSDGLLWINRLDNVFNVVAPLELRRPVVKVSQAFPKRVVLNWNFIEGAEGYRIQRRTQDEAEWEVVAEIDNQILAFTDENFTLGTQYLYRSQAFNNDQVSDFSEAVVANLDYTPMELTATEAPEPGFVPDEIFVGNGNILYVVSLERSLVYRWNPVTQEWLMPIQLGEEPSALVYSEVGHELVVAYPTEDDRGEIRKIDLFSPDFEERLFVEFERPFNYLSQAGLFTVANDIYKEVRSFDSDGNQVDAPLYALTVVDGVWSDSDRRLYYRSRSANPGSLREFYYREVKADGAFGDVDRSLGNSVGLGWMTPMRVKPDGSMILTGSGYVFEPSELLHLGLLEGENPTLIDAAWLGTRLYVLRENEIAEYDDSDLSVKYRVPWQEGYSIRATQSGALLIVGLDEQEHFYVNLLSPELELIPPTELAPPTFSQLEFGENSLTLHWGMVQGASQYLIEKQNDNGEWDELGVQESGSLFLLDNELSRGEEYVYRVQALNGELRSNASSPLPVTFDNPESVTGFTGTAVSETEIQLSWDSQLSAESYLIQRQLAPRSWLAQTVPLGFTFGYINSGLEPGSEYTFQIAARNGLGDSVFSDTITIKTLISPPSNPNELFVSVVGSFEARLVWGDVSSAAGYRLERKNLSIAESEWEIIAELGGDENFYRDSALEPQMEYQFQLVAFNEAGESAAAVFDPFTTLEPMIPESPNFRRVSIPSLNIRIEWDPALNAQQYVLLRKVAGSSEFVELAVLPFDEFQYIDEATELGELYEYLVLARNEVGDSVGGDPVAVSITGEEILLRDDFDTLEFNRENWGYNSGSAIVEGGSNGSVGYMHFLGEGSRMLFTPLLTVLDGGKIIFDLRAGNPDDEGVQWDNSEPGDEILLEYQIGMSWSFLAEFNTVYPAHKDWVRHAVDIPQDLNGKEVRFRWRQKAFDTGMDQWGLDNVVVSSRILMPPPAPKLLTLVEFPEHASVLYWLPVENAEYYTIERAEGPEMPWIELAVVETPYYHWVDEVSGNGGFSYRVSSGNTTGQSTPSPASLLPRQDLTAIEQWRLQLYGNISGTGQAADEYIGENGLPNLVSFAFGISPTSPLRVFDPGTPAEGGLPFYELNDGTGLMTVMYLRRREDTVPDLTYQIQTVDQLGSDWEAKGSIVQLTPIGDDWEMVKWEEESTSSDGSRFLQFSIRKQ